MAVSDVSGGKLVQEYRTSLKSVKNMRMWSLRNMTTENACCFSSTRCITRRRSLCVKEDSKRVVLFERTLKQAYWWKTSCKHIIFQNTLRAQKRQLMSIFTIYLAYSVFIYCLVLFFSFQVEQLCFYPLAHHFEECGPFPGVRTATWAAVFIARECIFPRGQCEKHNRKGWDGNRTRLAGSTVQRLTVDHSAVAATL